MLQALVPLKSAVDVAVIPAATKATIRDRIAALIKRAMEAAKVAAAANKGAATAAAVTAADDAVAAGKAYVVLQLQVKQSTLFGTCTIAQLELSAAVGLVDLCLCCLGVSNSANCCCCCMSDCCDAAQCSKTSCYENLLRIVQPGQMRSQAGQRYRFRYNPPAINPPAPTGPLTWRIGTLS